MSDRNYWLDLFSGKSWQEFLDAGAEVSGFRESRWKTVQQMKPGDYLLCYMTGISRWIGILEVVSEPFKDNSPIWSDQVFPARVRVRVVAKLEPETGVPVTELRNELSMFQNMTSPFAWTGRFRGSPSKWKASDGEAVVRAVLEAERNPHTRPVDPAKLARKPPILRTKFGPVTVPGAEEPTLQPTNIQTIESSTIQSPAADETSETAEVSEEAKEPRLHTEVQWLLLKLGNDMGLDVWAARNDRNRSVNGHRFTELPRLKSDLPLQFDEVTNRTIELIDVLWLKGNAIVAAFEIECTTSIYSGLLRMSDLIAMQPNLNIQLYLVAPDERRSKVITEVNRPIFSRLSPPMREMCRFIPISTLREGITEVGRYVRRVNPDIVEDWSESCEIEEL